MAVDSTFNGNRIAWALLFAAALGDTLSLTLIKIRFNFLKQSDFNTLAELADYGLKFLESPYAIFALITLLFTPLISFIALSRIQISTAYPVLAALHLFFIETFSHLLLHEPMSIKKVLGVACIFASLFLFYIYRDKEAG